MNPIDDVTRRLMEPVLTPFGFRRKGREFRVTTPSGSWATAEPRAFKLGTHQAEFHVDCFVDPGLYEEYRTRDQPGTRSGVGLWNGRPRVPEPTTPMWDHWSFDLGDRAAEKQFMGTLADFVARFMPLLDPSVMLDHVRSPRADLKPVAVRKAAAIPVLLAQIGPSAELERRLVELEDTEPGDQWAAQNRELAAFLRRHLADA